MQDLKKTTIKDYRKPKVTLKKAFKTIIWPDET